MTRREKERKQVNEVSRANTQEKYNESIIDSHLWTFLDFYSTTITIQLPRPNSGKADSDIDWQ